MSTRLIGIVIGLLVAAFYAVQLSQAMRGRGTTPQVGRRPPSPAIALVGMIIGLAVAGWWFLS